MKNAAGIWKFNKQVGSCKAIPDDQESVGNPGCKNLDQMVPENSGLDITCRINGQEQFICNLDCPEGTFFMGKDGKLKWPLVNSAYYALARLISFLSLIFKTKLAQS